jgi:hypothetical protein
MTVDPLPPCAFRRVQRGQTLCTRATDEFDQAVWPTVCANCPVPGWLATGICKHLDIGTEVGKNLAAESPRVLTACRFFGVHLEGLERCRTCPEFAAWEAGTGNEPAAASELAQSLPGEVLEEAMREALDRYVRQEKVRMMQQCFRAGATQCLRFPQFTPNGVLVLPPASLRGTEPYPALVAQVLHSGGVEGLVYTDPMRDVDSLCDLCLSVQQCARVVLDLSEWDVGALFTMGLAGALGRPMLLLRGQDTTPPFAPQGLPISSYATGEELAMMLVEGLGLEIKEEGASQEATAAEERPIPEEAPAQEKGGQGDKPVQEEPEVKGRARARAKKVAG